MRHHGELSMNAALRIAESTRVPCRSRESKRGCGAAVGEQCVNLTPGPNYGQPLGGLGSHVDRLADAHSARELVNA